jgi:hypothetical protein
MRTAASIQRVINPADAAAIVMRLTDMTERALSIRQRKTGCYNNKRYIIRLRRLFCVFILQQGSILSKKELLQDVKNAFRIFVDIFCK